MILLFMSVWAIVIALNEVLFSAQPFSLASIAAALPHTVMFTVVLSAAVVLAKIKILDAIKKGRPIDKRFVAELTPQVGHELNNMRKKLESMDGKKSGKGKNVDAKVYPSDSELKKSEKDSKDRSAINKVFDKAHDKLTKEAESAAKKEEAERKKTEEKERKAKEKQAALDAKAKIKEEKERLKAAKEHEKSLTKRKSHSSLLSGFGEEKDKKIDKKTDMANLESLKLDNDVDVKDVLAASREALSDVFGDDLANKNLDEKKRIRDEAMARAEETMRRRQKIGTEGPKKQALSIEERNAVLARAREHRAAQIDALSALSQEDRATEKQRQEAKMRAQLAAKLKEDQQKRRIEALSEKERLREEAIARANKARMQKELEQKMLQEPAVATVSETKVHPVRIAKPAAPTRQSIDLQPRADAPRRDGSEMVKRQDVPVSNRPTTVTVGKAPVLNKGAGVDVVVKVENDTSNLDVSELKKYQGPKRGAGLDLSALKKASLGPTKESPIAETAAEVRSRMAQQRQALSRGGHQNIAEKAAEAQAAADEVMNAAARAHAPAPRRPAPAAQDLSSYQEQNRARALQRAQAPKQAAVQGQAQRAYREAPVRQAPPVDTSNMSPAERAAAALASAKASASRAAASIAATSPHDAVDEQTAREQAGAYAQVQRNADRNPSSPKIDKTDADE